MRTVIVGAGIGGLAAALSLDAAGLGPASGHEVIVYERADEIRGLGVGLNLLPHAMRELTELGLEGRVARLGVPPSTLAYYNRFGQPIWSEPRGLAAGYRWPQQSVHRGRLQLALRDAVQERLGDVIRLGHRLTDVESGDGSDTAVFRTATGEVRVTADVIVGADGIHSALRALRYPAEGAPPWSGLTIWRGTAVVPPFLDGRTMIMAGDGEQKFVAYPLSEPAPSPGSAGSERGSRAREEDAGRQTINFIAERRGGGVPSPTADWNRAVDPAPIAELFRDWAFDWLDVPATIAGTAALLEYPMVDRDALPRWTFGRSTLLGDAAHAMYPNGSNGGSQAILDARTLAYHLATAGSVTDALAAYEDARRPVTARLLEMTRQTGPERVMLLARERAPQGFADVHDVIPQAELEQIAAAYKRTAGFDPVVLDERPSLSVRR